MPNDDKKILENINQLSDAEKNIAFSILKEISNTGKSDLLTQLKYRDYAEIPVDIETFLHNPIYLGKGLTNEEGRFTVFPYWVKVLKKLFPTNIDTAYNTLILTGGVGLGKSLMAVLCILYMLYRMLCLKNPYTHYGLQPIDKITFSFINISLQASKGVAWDKCQQLIQSSEWFLQHGTLNKGNPPIWQPNKNIELIFGSLPRHIIGRAVFASFEDEVSFQPNQDIEKQKEKAMELISLTDARMKSRFLKGLKLPTLNILASSKRTEQSFLESYIDLKKRNESKTTLIIDEPQWVIRDDKDTKEKFKVAVGNKFLNSEVLPLNISDNDLQIYLDKGFKILDVPMGYYENFVDDIDIALTDIAGISTTSAMKFIAGPRWAELRKPGLENPMTKEVITVGNAPDDLTQYYDFFDLTKVPDELKSRPLYIHLDMSVSGDRTGIAGVWIIGKKPHQDGVPDNKELYYRLAFSFAVKAPKGHQISFEKNRQFIYWLREHEFNIEGVSTDSFQNVGLAQSLKAHGYNYKKISVDIVTDGVCAPYQYFKNTIYEGRLETYKTDLLTREIIDLERDSNGKINHPQGGTVGCFVGDTRVSLVDGRSLTMKELVKEYEEGKVNWVYSFNEKRKRIEPKPILKAQLTIKDATLIKVLLDNDKEIICTPNHRFMLGDVTYREAKDLREGTSLMSLYTKISKDEEVPNGFKPDKIKTLENHKVKKIELLNYKADVYDLTIKDNHNFALSAGVFVHNSKDISDAVCGSIFFASQDAEKYAFDYGENLNLIQEVSTSNTNTLQKQLVVDFEEELKKVQDPILKWKEKVKEEMNLHDEKPKQSVINGNGMIIW